jgi:hypothetical protein
MNRLCALHEGIDMVPHIASNTALNAVAVTRF